MKRGYRRPPRPGRELYKGFYILPDATGEKFSVVDVFGSVACYPLATVDEARRWITARYWERLKNGRAERL
jgi:hypothetical protein